MALRSDSFIFHLSEHCLTNVNHLSRPLNLCEQCSGVLDGLLSNGRLTLEQLIDRDRGDSSCLIISLLIAINRVDGC